MAHIGVLWPNTMGYVVAGLRELVRRGHNVDLFAGRTTEGFEAGVVDGVRIVDLRREPARTHGLAVALICGWHVPEFRRLATRIKCPRVLYFDTQWHGTPRQRAGRLISPWLIHRRFDYAFVPGRRQEHFARRIGFDDDQILRGALTYDSGVFRRVESLATTGLEGRRQFLFAGRLVPAKGVDVLMDAYETYASQASDPWELAVAGDGPERTRIQRSSVPVRLLGHLSAADLANEMQRSACFVLPSRFEPYGVVIQEAAAAGLPIITTNRAGAVSEVVEPGVSGYLAAADEPLSLQRRMTEIATASVSELGRMGDRGRSLAESYMPARWADSLLSVLNR